MFGDGHIQILASKNTIIYETILSTWYNSKTVCKRRMLRNKVLHLIDRSLRNHDIEIA